MNEPTTSRHPVVGWLLVAFGIIGMASGAVPLTVNTLRIVVDEHLWNMLDFTAHGVESLGLSIEWGMLSSAMGTCLGILLLSAGVGWIKDRPWAVTVSWSYILAGLSVNIPDMLIFAFRARLGDMRTKMLVLDGIALLIPLVLALWLVRTRKSRKA